MAVDELERWMWAEACDLMVRAERLHRQFFTPSSIEGTSGWSPPVDLYETENELVVLVALPGVEPTDVEIGLDQWTLQVRGHRRIPGLVRGAAIHRLEIPQGRFLLRFHLPAQGVVLSEHGFEHGCLFLRLTKPLRGMAKR